MDKLRFVIRNPEILGNCLQMVANLSDFEHPKEVIIQDYKKKRSLEQSALMWCWAKELSDGYYLHYGELYSPDTWKVYMQTKLLGYRERALPGGEITQELIGTSKLSVKQFSEFLDRWDHFCADDLGVPMSHNNHHYDEAMV